MNVEQRKWTEALGWTAASRGGIAKSSQLVLLFGAAAALQKPDLVAAIRKDYPTAYLLGCSTAGEICGTQVFDDSLVITAVYFEHTLLRSAEISLTQTPDSLEAGEWIGQNLPRSVRDAATGAEEKLAHVLVLTDGLKVNGSDFVSGVMKHLPEGVTMTGGLAGDGARFGETRVFRSNAPETGAIAALGLYGSRLKIGVGSLGGWDEVVFLSIAAIFLVMMGISWVRSRVSLPEELKKPTESASQQSADETPDRFPLE